MNILFTKAVGKIKLKCLCFQVFVMNTVFQPSVFSVSKHIRRPYAQVGYGVHIDYEFEGRG